MNRETLKYTLAFFVVLLVCGGGCMYMPYVPENQMDLKAIGLDEHTRARLQGQADPRPGDPEPATGFSGRLAVVPLHMHWDGFYGFTANTTPSDRSIERLEQLTGIDQAFLAVIDFRDYHEARRHSEEPPPKIDFKERLLQTAKATNADLVLAYTTGHRAKSFDLTLGIGQIFLLGFCPTVVFSADADTSAVLMDAKTGYIYALTTGEGDDGMVGIGWSQAKKKAKAASEAAEESFDEVVDRIEEAWPELQSIYP